MSSIQDKVEACLANVEPDVEVLLAEVVGGATLRLFIDHPDGVSLDLCERVSKQLTELRERYALEVSSPGRERPLTKPSHFRRFVGERARVHTQRPLDGRDNFTGELVGASELDLTLAAESGVMTIPYVEIQRCTLVGD